MADELTPSTDVSVPRETILRAFAAKQEREMRRQRMLRLLDEMRALIEKGV